MKECEFINTQNSEYCNMVYMQEINDNFKHYKMYCKDNVNCVFKQLLAEQAKNKKLVEALGLIATQKIDYSFDGLCNLKLDGCTNDCKNCLKSLAQQALNEVNK